MKATIVAFSAAGLIVAVPAAFAQDVSSKPSTVQHKLSRKHAASVPRHATWQEMQARGSARGYPGAFGYVPSGPRDMTDISPQGGGGGM